MPRPWPADSVASSARAGELRRRLAEARLYLCTDARLDRGDLAEFVDAALAGGVDIVQLRHKGLEARQEMEHLATLRRACDRHGALLSVNDRADIAYAVRADVLHLGQDDLPVAVAREIVGPDMLIGRSTHSRDQVDEAAGAAGVDYFCVGPVWPTPTKPGRPAPGLALVEYAADLEARGLSDGHPWFAIGGIDARNLDQVIDAGARRIVVVRALTAADDPRAAAASLASRLR